MRGRGSVAHLGVAAASMGILAGAASGVSAADMRAAAARASSTVGGLVVSVAYAENVGNTPTPAAAFPVPWNGSPNTTFLGGINPQTAECGVVMQCYDSGGIRLENRGSSPVSVDKVTAAVRPGQPGGQTYSLWGSFTVPPGQSVILAENPSTAPSTRDNFDSSDNPHGNCSPLSGAPTVAITIGGVVTTLTDSTHVLDTGGIDTGGCPAGRNESTQWRQVGAAGTSNATVTLGPMAANAFTGRQVTDSATVLDGGGVGLSDASVTFTVVSGPDAGHTGGAVTDANGHASFSFAGVGQGEDVVVATVATDANPIPSNQARLVWANDSASGWTGMDIGGAVPAGGQSFATATGTWTVNGGGRGLGAGGDQFHYVYQAPSGGGGVTARLVSQSHTDPGAQAGLLVRATSDPGSPDYGVVITTGGGAAVVDRTMQGGPTTTLTTVDGTPPAYLWIAAGGGTYTVYTSPDGYFWQPVAGSSVAIGLGSAPLVGLVVASNNSMQASGATFDSVAVAAGQPPGPLPVSCPTPWTCADIGAVSAAGSAVESGNGSWTLQGAGNDINGVADQFFLAARALSGDGSISTHVTSQGATNPWAKTGVMIRATTDPAALEYGALVTPANGIEVAYRAAAGANTSTIHLAGAVPAYLMVARASNAFTAYTSADGVAWAAVAGSTRTMAMPATVLAGLADTAHTNAALSTVGMDTVVFSGSSGPPPPCPTNWICGDVGSPTVAGSESIGAGTWTIHGAGNDIHGTADQFQFDSEVLAGDGSISAHVTSQTNTNAWAKAGVMLRATSGDPGSIDYALLVTPGNGIIVQDRLTEGGTTNRIATIAAVTLPTYLKVSRSGTGFTAYTSTDGAAWTLVAGSTVTIGVSGAMFEGLAVTSHNSGQLSTATMDTVRPT